MKQTILEALKTKFVGVSDSILGRVADKLAKTTTNTEDVETAVAGVTFQSIIEAESDRRATEAQQTAIKNYEAKHQLKDGVKLENGGNPVPKPQPKPDDEVPAWAKAIIEGQKQLADRQKAMETERLASARRQQLNSAIEKLPETLRKGYSRTSVESLTDDEFTALIGEVKTEVDSAMADLSAKGARFGRPTTQGGNPGEELTKAQLDQIGKRNGGADDSGQPF